MAWLLSVNVGQPRDIEWRGQIIHTSVWKQPVEGRRLARRLNIDGDAQGDLAGHGGEHRAVMVYQMDSYRYWERELNRSDFTFGQFGENFRIEGLPDNEVRIGDRYRIGGALFEVTQPRVTCYRVGIRMNEPRMPALLVSHHRPGFYFRVLEEGEVGAGDEIVQVAQGPEGMTVAAVDALLYLPGPDRKNLERALQTPALSAGWKTSFEAILRQLGTPGGSGNAGLVSAEQRATAAPGFRPVRVTRIDHETHDVVSLVMEPTDGKPLTVALPGQFVALRLRPDPAAAPILRSYSLSGLPSANHYRLTIKREPHGVAGEYLTTQVRAGDLLEISAPRGAFTLAAGERPVVLLSAGVGVTPVLAMLHTLSAEASKRPIWWIYGARRGEDHVLAKEARELLATLPIARSFIQYSQPAPTDRPGVDFDAPGRLTVEGIERLGLPQDADFYLCGPQAFLDDLTSGLLRWGARRERVHSEIFGAGKASNPGVLEKSARRPHLPAGPVGSGPKVAFARAGLTAAWDPKYGSLLEFAEACDVPVRWSCRSGVCHTCECGLVSGSVKYDPDPLAPPAEGNTLICCARPTEDVVLDI